MREKNEQKSLVNILIEIVFVCVCVYVCVCVCVCVRERNYPGGIKRLRDY